MDAPPVDISKLTAPFPQEAIKTREGGGRRNFRYVEGHTVIRRLNEACNFNWSFTVLKEWQEGDILLALCELTLPGMGSRQHIGVQKFSPSGGEDLRKGHVTDALKKCATLFGVGLELVGPDYESEAEEAAKEQEERRQGADAIRHAKALFDSVAEENGLRIEGGAHRGQWANTCIGRSADSRAPLSLEDWQKAAQRLPEAIARTRQTRAEQKSQASQAAPEQNTAPDALFGADEARKPETTPNTNALKGGM